jgi:hypothetical protein
LLRTTSYAPSWASLDARLSLRGSRSSLSSPKQRLPRYWHPVIIRRPRPRSLTDKLPASCDHGNCNIIEALIPLRIPVTEAMTRAFASLKLDPTHRVSAAICSEGMIAASSSGQAPWHRHTSTMYSSDGLQPRPHDDGRTYVHYKITESATFFAGPRQVPWAWWSLRSRPRR